MKVFLTRHALVVIYFFMLLLVGIGLAYGFGTQHLSKILIYTVAFFLFYFLLSKWTQKRQIIKIPKIALPFSKQTLDLTLFFGMIGFIIFHLVFLGHVPFISAINTLDYYKIAFIRQDINAHDVSLIKYICAFMIKGIIPFALLYFSVTNKKLFYLFILFAIFYAISLMQKSLIVSIMVPSIIYALMTRKYIRAGLFSVISIAGVFVLVYATNPSLRASQDEIKKVMLATGQKYIVEDNLSAGESFANASSAIYTRVFITTGLVVGHWFDNIPSKYPYAKGCGYHFLAPVLGCNYEDFDYSRIIYDATYAKEAKLGLKGTVTVASFVYDYANFGYIGLCYSGLILALYLVFVNRMFGANHTWNMSLNALYIFWLTSGALTTMLLSGGWLITILLYKIFLPYISNDNSAQIAS